MAFRHVLQEIVGLAAIEGLHYTVQWLRSQISKCVYNSGFNIGLPALCVAWGLVCTFQGFVTSYGGLIAARKCTSVLPA